MKLFSLTGGGSNPFSAGFFCLAIMSSCVSFGSVVIAGNDHRSDDLAGYTIAFRSGKISLGSTKYEDMLPNDEEFPLIEPVVLQEKVKFSRGNIFLTPKVKAVAELSNPTISEKDSSSITFIYEVKGRCSGHMLTRYRVISSNAIEIRAKLVNDQEGSQCNGIKFSFKNFDDEIFSGIGTQVTNLNLNGKTFVSLSQEQGHGKGKQPITWIGNKFGKGAGGLENFSYAAIPHFITSMNRSFWVDTINHVHFDFRNKQGTTIISSEPQIEVRINHHLKPKELLKEFARRHGVMKPLPDWVHKGAILGIQGGRKKIDDALVQLKSHNASIASIWIQDWVGTRNALFSKRLKWNWRVDRSLYPRWESLVADYRADGYRVLTYFNPRLITGSECSEPCDFDEALRKDYLVKNNKGNTYFIGNGGFDFAKLDLSNQEAFQWYQEKIKAHIKLAPVSGWMVDFSESLPFDARLHNGLSGSSFHNQYIQKWGLLNRQVADEYLGDESFLFMRGGVLGSHTLVNAYWLGDRLMSWDKFDGMQSALIGSITSGLSGATVNHSDIGGMIRFNFLNYRISRDRKLFLKWLQMNVFSPILRTHEGTLPDLVHQFDSDEYTLRQFSYYTRLFREMFDYRKKLLEEAQRDGTPMMRGMFLEYPDDPRTWVVDDQLMLGSDILIAPIFKPKLENRSVYLPDGTWVELFSGVEYHVKGGQDILVAGRLESIPVYVRSGSKIAMRLQKFIKYESPPKLLEKK